MVQNTSSPAILYHWIRLQLHLKLLSVRISPSLISWFTILRTFSQRHFANYPFAFSHFAEYTHVLWVMLLQKRLPMRANFNTICFGCQAQYVAPLNFSRTLATSVQSCWLMLSTPTMQWAPAIQIKRTADSGNVTIHAVGIIACFSAHKYGMHMLSS